MGYKKRKKCVISLLFLGILISSAAKTAFSAASPTREQSFTSVGTGTTVSVSTSAWTAMPTSSSLTGRLGVMVTNDEANTSMIALLISSESSNPSEAITVHTIYLPTDSTIFVGVPSGLYLYGRYLGAAAGNAHVKEYIQ